MWPSLLPSPFPAPLCYPSLCLSSLYRWDWVSLGAHCPVPWHKSESGLREMVMGLEEEG